ncbi:peptide chain release factor 2 [Ruminococcaceae bacterium OttesenSCG-928-N02]|nr:peptide chain release factor 2 [Ruminococcaceae bacterium OttesenSCG-928-N02]
MLMLDELKKQMMELEPLVAELRGAISYERLVQQREELEHQSTEPDFWQNDERQASVFGKLGPIKSKLAMYEGFVTAMEDVHTYFELCEEGGGTEELAELETALANAAQTAENLRMVTLLSGEYDAKNAILTLHAGAGGTEAQDWAEMLYRMYTRYATAQGYKTQVLDYQDGDEAGLKSASFLIEGPNAYGMLRSENGVHRLVRVSPFDSSGRRHTSFASLEVMPEIDDTIEVDIREEDIKMDVYRASGAGGQHVNKTSSAVRLTHIPTGVVAACQTERSQFQNRDYAMKMLKAKLFQIKEREHLDKIEDIKGDQKEIAWGSQIRSYVFMPYTMVKDHRTGFETGNVDAVMDGDLNGFINAYLKKNASGEM